MLSDINDTCRRIARKLDIDMDMPPSMSVNKYGDIINQSIHCGPKLVNHFSVTRFPEFIS